MLLNQGVREFLSSGLMTGLGYYNDLGAMQSGMDFKETSISSSSFYFPRETYKANEDGYIPKDQLGTARDIKYTPEIELRMEKIAKSMVDIRYEDALDFLHILITINCPKIFSKIGEICDIPEFVESADELVNDAEKILDVPHLDRLSYLADAIISIIRLFQGSMEKPTANSAEVALEQIMGVFGILSSGFPGENLPVSAGGNGVMLGLALSKLLMGKEIPMNVQANNPSLVPPSVLGERLFGQSSFTFINDFKQPLQKKIGIFSRMGGASGMQSMMMNMSSLGNSMSVSSALSMIVNAQLPFEKMMGEQIEHHMSSSLGLKLTDSIELKYADNAIPFQREISNVIGGLLSTKRPEMDRKYRNQVERITSQVDGVRNLYKRGINLEEAGKNGLNPNSQYAEPLSINIEIPKIFLTSVFQEGWAEMAHVKNEMRKSGDIYEKILFILEEMVVRE